MAKSKQSKPAKFTMAQVYLGAHVRTKYNDYLHHGIYVGNEQVVEFGGADILENPSDVCVQITPIEEFLRGGFLEVREYSSAEKRRKFSDDKIAQRALEAVGEKGYNLLENNCEHFANFCVFGCKNSEQVDKMRNKIRELLKKC